MNAQAKNDPVHVLIKTEEKKQLRSASTFWEKAEFYRFGITPMLLVVIACIGGVAAAVGVQEGSVQLAAVALPTAFALSVILGVMPMRIIMISCSMAILIDLLVLFF